MIFSLKNKNNRGYGILVARIHGKNIHWRHIKTENLKEYKLLLNE